MQPDYNNLLQQIRSVAHFRHLSEESLREIVTAGNIVQCPAGQILFDQDEPCSGMYVLIKGQVNLCKLGPQGQQYILATIRPVIMFNEVAVVDGGPNPVTAIATQDSLFWQIGYEKFQSLLKRYPEIGLGLLRVLASRNRRLIEHYEDLSLRSVLARIAKLLLDLSENGRKTIERRDYPLEEMASLTATVPEAISRALKTLAGEGLITSSRSQIMVIDAEGLAKSALLKLDLED